MKVLIVCSGNICRSPMVAEYLRHSLNRSGMSDVVVASAGTLGIKGAPASEGAIRALAEIDIDLTGHRSCALSGADMRSSNVVIAMESGHLETLAARYPKGSEPRLLLRAFEAGPRPAADPPDLDDPIGRRLSVYRQRLDVIRVCVDHLVAYLRKIAVPS